MRQKTNAAPVGIRGGAKAGNAKAISSAEATRAGLLAQATFTPPGLLPMQRERHRRDIFARFKLGLPPRNWLAEG
jgi:hypothetical protein